MLFRLYFKFFEVCFVVDFVDWLVIVKSEVANSVSGPCISIVVALLELAGEVGDVALLLVQAFLDVDRSVSVDVCWEFDLF